MPKTKDISTELAQLQRDREAIVAQQRALDDRERLLLQRRKLERAKIISDAFAEVEVGDVDKRQATRLARAVRRLGIEQSLAVLEAPAPRKPVSADPREAGAPAGAPPPADDANPAATSNGTAGDANQSAGAPTPGSDGNVTELAA